MEKYVADGIFDEYKNSMIYIERIQSNGILRAGILGMIDLEEYDFSKGSTSQVRATEATVIERIPPRIKVRGVRSSWDIFVKKRALMSFRSCSSLTSLLSFI